MTHLSASRCVIATHFLFVPGKRGLPPTFPWNLFPRPTPFAVGRKLASFSCSIPPLFVLSHNISMINTTSNWLCFGAFLRGQQSQRDDAPTPLLDSTAMGTGAMLTRRVSWRALALHYPRGILGRHDRCGTPCSRQREHATQRKPWPTQSHWQDWHQPVGCVERATTHRSASRCVFATHPTWGARETWFAPNVPLEPVLPPHAVGRKLGSFFLPDSAFICSKSQYANG